MMSQIEPKEKTIERENMILSEIRRNPNLHHNALIKLIVPRHMAKTTFERTKNKLIEKNVLSVANFKNKKIYRITENYKKNSIQLIERISHENYQTLQHKIKRIKEDFCHKDSNEKIAMSIEILRGLLQIDMALIFLDSIKNSKKTLYKDEHLEIQGMISEIFKNISNDKDSELIYPAIISNLGMDISKNLEIEFK